MKKLLTILFIFLFPLILQARTVRVAVLDTGLNNIDNAIPLCKESKDFTVNDIPHQTVQQIKLKYFSHVTTTTLIPPPPFRDEVGHGTNISNIIDRVATKTDYCQIVLKVFAFKSTDYGIQHTIEALKYLLTLEEQTDIINYSAGGTQAVLEEKVLLRQLMDKGTVVIAAAGNNNTDLDKNCNYYPACYDPDIFVVGNIDAKGNKHEKSNYGKRTIDIYASGVQQVGGGYVMTGTSQATAVVSGQMVTVLDKTYNKRVPQGGELEMVTKSAEAFYIQTGLRDYTTELYKKRVNKNTQVIVEKLIPLSNMVIQRKFVIEKSF